MDLPMVTISGKATQLKEAIRRLAVPISSTKALFNPLRLTFVNGKVRCAAQSEEKNASVLAELSMGTINGDGDVVVDAVQLLKYLKLYADDEDVTIEVGDKIVIRGARKTSTLYTEGLTPLVMTNLPKIVDGVIHYKTSGPATTRVEVMAEELQALVKDAAMVEMVNFPLTFAEKDSWARIGSGEAKHPMIETQLNCVVTGPAASTTLGAPFIPLVENLRGTVRAQLSEAHPLIVLHEENGERLMYSVNPRRME